jgi:acetyltransferase-like isoleucine patch superfamily enzyme
LDEDQLEIEAKGGVTFCIAAEPDSKRLHIAVAECSNKDLYNKEIGRQVALGRFVKIGEYVTFEWNREITIAENLELQWFNYFYHLHNDPKTLELTVKSCYLDAE